MKFNKANKLNVRKGAGVQHGIITAVPKGNKEYTASKQTKVTVNGITSTWMYIDQLGGWVNTYYATITNNPNVKKPDKNSVTVVSQEEIEAERRHNERMKEFEYEKERAIDSAVKTLLDNARREKENIDASTRLFGQPFQFTSSTDNRIVEGKSPLGRKYLETIIAEAPIAYIIPGGANFLPDIKRKEKQTILQNISNAGDRMEKWVMEDLLKTDMRYFDFIPDYFTYMKYVNMLCRTSAGFMGLDEYKYYDWSMYKYQNVIDGKQEKEYEHHLNERIKDDEDVGLFDEQTDKKEKKRTFWERAVDKALGRKNMILDSIATGTNYQYVQFYVDPSTSFQESSSNSTAQSIIADTLDKGSSMMKEVAFITNSAGGGWAGNITDGIMNGASNMTEFMAGIGGNGIFGRVMQSADAIIDGGNMIFPDIWGDSDYTKSYNITVNLVSPYGSKDSIYLHVLVPLFHLLVLALPRQITSNAYGHPFLVRVSSKGWFNSEMGIVDSIQFERVQGSYSVDGLPTEIRVNLSVRDLYSALSTTPTTDPGKFLANSSLINWLAVISGLDITKAAFAEKWQLVTMIVTGKLAEIPTNPFDKVMDYSYSLFTKFTHFN